VRLQGQAHALQCLLGSFADPTRISCPNSIRFTSCASRTVSPRGEPYFTDEVLADGLLTITNTYGTVNYVCEIKTGLTDDVVEQVVEYFSHLGDRLKHDRRPLLITLHLSNLVVDRLLEKNIKFIDIEGNIYLNSPEIYILICNQLQQGINSLSSNNII
jgi:hypothetical protein